MNTKNEASFCDSVNFLSSVSVVQFDTDNARERKKNQQQKNNINKKANGQKLLTFSEKKNGLLMRRTQVLLT